MTYQLEELVDSIAVFMSCSEWTHYEGIFRNQRLTPLSFSKAEPLIQPDGSLLPMTYDEYTSFGFIEIGQVGASVGVFCDAKITDLDGPLHTTFITCIAEDGDATQPTGAITAFRMHLCTRQEVRGQTPIFYPYMIDCSQVNIKPNGQAMCSRYFIGGTGNGKWIRITRHRYDAQTLQDVNSAVTNMAQVALGLQFSRRYYWRVELGYIGHPSILIPTDPIGAQEVFRLRDIPEGKQRRSALHNWVKEHWRQSRSDAAEDIRVRQHLRGALEFTWNDLRCVIRPSTYDMALNRKLAEERKAQSQ